MAGRKKPGFGPKPPALKTKAGASAKAPPALVAKMNKNAPVPMPSPFRKGGGVKKGK